MLIPKHEQPKRLQVHWHLLAQVKKCGGLRWISGNYPEAPALKEKMPKADEATQNTLFYPVWNWSLQVRARQMCKANRNIWATNALPVLKISLVLLSSAIIQFLSQDKD